MGGVGLIVGRASWNYTVNRIQPVVLLAPWVELDRPVPDEICLVVETVVPSAAVWYVWKLAWKSHDKSKLEKQINWWWDLF